MQSKDFLGIFERVRSPIEDMQTAIFRHIVGKPTLKSGGYERAKIVSLPALWQDHRPSSAQSGSQEEHKCSGYKSSGDWRAADPVGVPF